MAFKYVLLSFCALVGVASAGFLAPATTYAASYPVVAKVAQPHYDAVGTTQQNVVHHILLGGGNGIHGGIGNSHMAGQKTGIGIGHQGAERDEVAESHVDW